MVEYFKQSAKHGDTFMQVTSPPPHHYLATPPPQNTTTPPLGIDYGHARTPRLGAVSETSAEVSWLRERGGAAFERGRSPGAQPRLATANSHSRHVCALQGSVQAMQDLGHVLLLGADGVEGNHTGAQEVVLRLR